MVPSFNDYFVDSYDLFRVRLSGIYPTCVANLPSKHVK